MIDEKKLIEEIRKYHAELKPRYATKLVDAEILDIIDIIEEQPKVGEWIPCSERLPECDVKVLVTIKIDGMYVLDIAERWENELESGWFYTDEWFDVTLSDINVTAWQPLPQPYKGE